MAVCYNKLLDRFMKNLNIKFSESNQDKLEALG
jgi:hypothetical protein